MKKGQDCIGITVGFYCHDGNGNVLLAKRSVRCRDEQGTWDTGGGALEFGESVESRLREEIKEEYGTDIVSYKFLGYRDVFREQQGVQTHWIALDFKVLIDRSKVKNGEPHKFDEIGWFTFDTLPSPLHSQLHFALGKYNDELRSKEY